MSITDRLIANLQRHVELGPDELKRLASLTVDRRNFRDGEVIISADDKLKRSCVLAEGLALRVHPADGLNRKRVITAVHVPGDFVDLHGFLLSRLRHDVVASGAVVMDFVQHDELREITRTHPRLTRILMMCTAIDAAVNRTWLMAAASLQATAHLAHLLCEIYVRLEQAGVAAGRQMRIPLLQRDLADMLGYSTVHVNRAVRELRDSGALRWNGQDIEILNWDELTRIGRFKPNYLWLSAHRQ
ncbi:MAG: Crp/Fnr family transcriptional regulator [Paracoccus sp. (in: a-proteobacteria)]|nr:Crp/Fnr family transcriptional regulator [Paracoccus sp. (in: a-proteobacteria)]